MPSKTYFNFLLFVVGCEAMIAFPFQTDCGGGAARNCKFFSRLAFFVWLCYTGQVKPLPGTVHGQSDSFAPTHWSVIIAAGRSEADPELARAALTQLCQTYWAPLYSFVRNRGHAVHDAQDLTQSFFAYLIEHKIYARADREKGKFRSFLLALVEEFPGARVRPRANAEARRLARFSAFGRRAG
jgi:hypothetical protein